MYNKLVGYGVIVQQLALGHGQKNGYFMDIITLVEKEGVSFRFFTEKMTYRRAMEIDKTKERNAQESFTVQIVVDCTLCTCI